MTVGRALWPDLLSDEERAWLDPGLPSELDRRPDVLVVGGGILGVATAVACIRARLGSVVLIERDRLGAGASGGAAGMLIPEAHVGVDPPALVEFMRNSLEAWRDLEQTWPRGVGLVDVDWLGIELGESPFGATLPPNAERLDASQVDRLVPGLSQVGAAVLAHRQARVNPLRAIARLVAGLPSVATGVDGLGVSIDGGRVVSLKTTAGGFTPGVVVFATGTPPRMEGLELDVPASEVKGHILALEPSGLRLPGSVAGLATSIDDGRLLAGGTLDVDDAERVVRPEVIASMVAGLKATWPVLRGVRVSHQWACFRPAHPDHLPVVDRIPSLSNAWLTSGHYKTGILMAPATGRALAAWIGSGHRPAEVVGLGADRFASIQSA